MFDRWHRSPLTTGKTYHSINLIRIGNWILNPTHHQCLSNSYQTICHCWLQHAHPCHPRKYTRNFMHDSNDSLRWTKRIRMCRLKKDEGSVHEERPSFDVRVVLKICCKVECSPSVLLCRLHRRFCFECIIKGRSFTAKLFQELRPSDDRKADQAPLNANYLTAPIVLNVSTM